VHDVLVVLLKVSLVAFMAGNLLDMGLRLNPQDALTGLRNGRFVVRGSGGPAEPPQSAFPTASA